MNVDPSFERPYRLLLADSLVHVRPATGDPGKRRAFARLAHFLMRSLSPDERLVADVLEAAMASTDHAVVVRYLLCGVWAVVDDDPRLLGWFTKVANRALERQHLAGFCACVQLLVHVPGFDPRVSTAWLDGICSARDDVEAQPEAFWLGVDWMQAFHPAGKPAPPAWLLELRADERLGRSVSHVTCDRMALSCPLCGKAFTP